MRRQTITAGYENSYVMIKRHTRKAHSRANKVVRFPFTMKSEENTRTLPQAIVEIQTALGKITNHTYENMASLRNLRVLNHLKPLGE